MPPLCSIVILTNDSLGVVNRLIETLAVQEFPFPCEYIFMDNASRDGTVDYLNAVPFPQKRILHVPTGEFSHSRTRMRAAEEARGEWMVFFTDDILPVGTSFLKNLTQPVREGKAAAAYGVCQIDPVRHDPIDAFLHNRWYETYDDAVEPLSQFCWEHLTPDMRRRLSNFDNCASCIRRDVLLRLRFSDVPYGEDMLFAKKLILSGQGVAMAKEARFFHWHKVRFSYMLKRMCIDSDIAVREFGAYYARSLAGVAKAVLLRIVHRAYIGFFRVRMPAGRKIYWVLYNAKILTADFFGKYLGTLHSDIRKRKFAPLQKRLLKMKEGLIAEIGRRSIKRY